MLLDLVVFDIAGTIIEDHGEVVQALTEALQHNHIPIDANELNELKGASKVEVIRHFARRQTGNDPDPAFIERVHHEFRAIALDLYRKQTRPIAGAAESFAWLRTHGLKIALNTGFDAPIIQAILESTGWTGDFDAIVGSDQVAQGRPAPYLIFRAMELTGVTSVHRVMAVGDTPLDLQAATNAGVAAAVGVLTGMHPRSRLEREPHAAIVPSVADLPSLIESGYTG